MRTKDQKGLGWKQVDFGRRQIHLPKTKDRDSPAIPVGAVVLGASGHRGLKPGILERIVFPSLRKSETSQGSHGWFSTAVEEARFKQYSWHCNRHTFAGRLVMAGVDLRTVAERLGHETLQRVMRYSHLAHEHWALAVDIGRWDAKGQQIGHWSS
jgi:integrase